MSDITSITEDTTIKGIFADAGTWMQVSDSASPTAISTITIEIPKS